MEDAQIVIDAAAEQGRQGRARRPLARRVCHHRLRHMGLRRKPRRRTARRPRLHRRRQPGRPGHRGGGHSSARRTQRTGGFAMAVLRRDPRTLCRTVQRHRLVGRSARPRRPIAGSGLRAATRGHRSAGRPRPMSASTATPSMSAPHPRASPLRRHTWAQASPTTVVGTAQVPSLRSTVTPPCSPEPG